MGIISTGCALCRKRRIKCDEAKPGCHRCFKIGAQCPGYERGLKLIFYTEDGQAPKQQPSATVVARRRSPIAAASPDPSLSSTSSQTTRRSANSSLLSPNTSANQQPWAATQTAVPCLDVSNGYAWSDPVHKSLTPDIETRSVCLFITSFTQEARSKSQGPALLDFLPDLYAACSPSSCLHRTLNAIAQLNFLNRYKAGGTLSDWAEISYGRALRSVNLALSTPKLATSQETLMSVWLLSMYELLAPGDLAVGHRTPWVNHINGTLQLLCMRGQKQVSTRLGRQLFRVVHLPIIAMTMMMGHRPPKEVAQLNEAMFQNDAYESRGPYLLSIQIQDVAIVRSKIREWFAVHQIPDPQTSDVQTLEQTIRQGLQVEAAEDFIHWASSVAEWQPYLVTHRGTTLLQSPEFGKYFFTSTYVMYYWLIAWTTKALLIQSLLNGLGLLQTIRPDRKLDGTDVQSRAALHANVSHLKSKLNDAIDNIIGSTAFAFGDIDTAGRETASSTASTSAYNDFAAGAFHMFWPAGAVLACPYATTDQKFRARSALQSIGERFCIVQALQYVRF